MIVAFSNSSGAEWTGPKQTTTTTATRMSLNKRFSEQNNSCARALLKSLYISLPSSEKQQREMSNFCVVL